MFKEASSAKAHNSLEFVTGQLKPPSKVAAGIFSEELGVQVRVEIAHCFNLWGVCVCKSCFHVCCCLFSIAFPHGKNK